MSALTLAAVLLGAIAVFFDIWKDFSILAYQLFVYRPAAAHAATAAAASSAKPGAGINQGVADI